MLNKTETTESELTTQPRTLEELENVPLEDMTKQELIVFAENLRDENYLHRNQSNDIRKGYENLFRENAALKEKTQKAKIAAFQQINYFKDQIAMLYRTTLLIKNMED